MRRRDATTHPARQQPVAGPPRREESRRDRVRRSDAGIARRQQTSHARSQLSGPASPAQKVSVVSRTSSQCGGATASRSVRTENAVDAVMRPVEIPLPVVGKDAVAQAVRVGGVNEHGRSRTGDRAQRGEYCKRISKVLEILFSAPAQARIVEGHMLL